MRTCPKIAAVVGLALISWFGSVMAQNRTAIDSLNQLVKSEVLDEEQAMIQFDLARYFAAVNVDSARSYSLKGKAISEEINFPKGIINGHLHLAKYLRDLSQYDSSKVHIDIALDFLDEHSLSLEDELMLRISACTRLVAIAYHENDMESALKYSLEAVEYDKQLGETVRVANLYYDIAAIFAQMQIIDKTEEYLWKALNKSIEYQDAYFAALSYNEIGQILIRKEHLDSAMVMHRAALKIADSIHTPFVQYQANFHIGHIYEIRGDLDAALQYMQMAHKFAQETQVGYINVVCLCRLGRIQTKLGDHRTALQLFKEYELVTSRLPEVHLEAQCLKWWGEAEQQAGNLKRSNELFKLYVQTKDSIVSVQRDRLVVELETKYQTAQKESQLLEQQLEIEKQTARAKRKNILMATLAGLAFLITILLIQTYRSNKQRLKLKEERIKVIEKENELSSVKAMMEGEEKERVRIARELHDGLGGSLAAIRMKLSTLPADQMDEKANESLHDIDHNLERTSDEVRRISHNLMPEVLINFGLVKALEDFINRINSSAMLKASFQHFGMQERLNKNTELSIYRIIQELMNNIIKHSGASKALIQLNRTENALHITVEDDGKGFDSGDVEDKGIGMSNVKARLNTLKGDMNIDSQKDVGTSVYIEIQLDK